MRKLTRIAAGAVLGTSVVAFSAQAQFSKPDSAIKYRQSVMYVQQVHMSRLGAMVNGRAPFDQAAAEQNAAVVEQMSRLPWSAFGPGTDKGRTNALPEVWKDRAGFDKYAQQLQEVTMKLAAAVKSGGANAAKGPFDDVVKACDRCHDEYRKD
jgi:cytochrome c556